jgi:hypothetical protein
VEVQITEDQKLADFLTAEGVLLRPDAARPVYCVASSLMDGLVRACVIPAQFPNGPESKPPHRNNETTLCVLETLIESLKFFDKDLICMAPERSYKYSKVKIGGKINVAVPRESVYDTELMRILGNWLRQSDWSVTGQWHVWTDLGSDKFSDIVLQKDNHAPIVLELLATGESKVLQEHFKRVKIYKQLLLANEAWIIHFTLEDDYRPTWQSSQDLGNGINVVHFVHDLGFTRVRMMARCQSDGAEYDNRDLRL